MAQLVDPVVSSSGLTGVTVLCIYIFSFVSSFAVIVA